MSEGDRTTRSIVGEQAHSSSDSDDTSLPSQQMMALLPSRQDSLLGDIEAVEAARGSAHVTVIKSKPVARTRKAKSSTKPDGKPRRPLSAYNFFVRLERARIKVAATADGASIEEDTGCPRDNFVSVGKLLASRWKELPDVEKVTYQLMADEDMTKYQKALRQYQLKSAQKKQDRSSLILESTYANLASSPEAAYSGVAAVNGNRSHLLQSPASRQAGPLTASSYYYRQLAAGIGSTGLPLAPFGQDASGSYNIHSNNPLAMQAGLQLGQANSLLSQSSLGQPGLAMGLQQLLLRQQLYGSMAGDQSQLLQALQSEERLRQAQLLQLQEVELRQSLFRNMAQPNMLGIPGLLQMNNLLGPNASQSLASLSPFHNVSALSMAGLLQRSQLPGLALPETLPRENITDPNHNPLSTSAVSQERQQSGEPSEPDCDDEDDTTISSQ